MSIGKICGVCCWLSAKCDWLYVYGLGCIIIILYTCNQLLLKFGRRQNAGRFIFILYFRSQSKSKSVITSSLWYFDLISRVKVISSVKTSPIMHLAEDRKILDLFKL